VTRPLMTEAPDQLRSIVRFARASGYTGPALTGYVRAIALASRLRVSQDRLAALVVEYSAAVVCRACNGRGIVTAAPPSPTLPYGPDQACEPCEGEGWVWPTTPEGTP
jgi:hypothetical protein